MKIGIAVFLIFLVALTSTAQQNSSDFNIRNFYEIEKSHSYVEFSVLYMGYAKVKGRFEDFNGMIRYDESDNSKTSVTFSINVGSIDSDIEWRDNDLKSEAWLDTAKFPTITFQSKRVLQNGEGINVIGDLTIKAITKEVTMKMNKPSGVLTDTRGDSQIIFSGNISIDRTDYGVEGKRWSKIKEGIAGVGNIIDIEVSILGKRMNERNISGWFRKEDRTHSQIFKTLNDEGIEAAKSKFNELKETTKWVNVNTLKLVGFYLLRLDRPKEALAMFEENTKAFPEVADLFNDLGEGYAENGDLINSKKAYETALALDADNTEALEVLRWLN